MRRPETNSVMTIMNKIELRKKLNLVRLLTFPKNFFEAFCIQGQAIKKMYH